MVRLDHREHCNQIECDRNRAEHAALFRREDLAHQQERYRAEAHREADHEHDQTDDRYIAVVGVAQRMQMVRQAHEGHGYAHHNTGHDEQRLAAGAIDHEQGGRVAGQLYDAHNYGRQITVNRTACRMMQNTLFTGFTKLTDPRLTGRSENFHREEYNRIDTAHLLDQQQR